MSSIETMLDAADQALKDGRWADVWHLATQVQQLDRSNERAHMLLQALPPPPPKPVPVINPPSYAAPVAYHPPPAYQPPSVTTTGGFTRPKRSGTGWIILLTTVALLGVLFVVIQSLDLKDDIAPVAITDSDGTAGGAYIDCRDAVKLRLKAPASADFPGAGSATITHTGKNWFVSSYVDAQNGFGAQIRSEWTCTATHTGSNNFRINSVNISE